MKRRSSKELLRAVENAGSAAKKARALYELALFHDNNSREAEAVPLYQKALQLGLDRTREAMARAWLASSLSKTKRPREALQQISLALKLAKRGKLRDFLLRLKTKIG
jgi:tetratricopeptide (TPR) repeat protein